MTFAESHLFRTDLRTRRELCAGTERGRSCSPQRKSVSRRRGWWGAGDWSLRAGVWPLFAALYSIPRARGALASLILVLVQGSSWAQTAPQLVSVSPPDGATLVPTTAALVFVFDQDMDTTLPPFQSIPNVIAGNFEVLATGFNQTLLATWGADKRTLTIRAAIQFPYATFTWRLNPPGGLFSFKSAAGVLLATVSGTFATGVGGTTPVLASSSPANHAMGVALDVQVTFNFDQIMKTNTAIGGMPPAVPAAVRWTGTGLDVAKFTYSWSANGRSLICDYAGDLPPSTEIRWELNPSDASVPIENPAGLRLPSGMYSGRFVTGTGIPCDPPTLPPDWGSYSLSRNGAYEQSSAADPVPLSGGRAFTLGAVVNSPAFGPQGLEGSLTRPGGSRTNLVLVAGLYLQHFESSPSEEVFRQTAPHGPYTLKFTLVGQPEREVVIDVPDSAPPVPKVTNFEEAQAIDADSDFVLAWNGIPEAGPQDYIALTIVSDQGRLVFQAPDLCVPRELPATATSIVIPARTLPTNAMFSATLVFNRVYYLSTNTIPKMSGFGNHGRSTQFNLRTGSRPPPPDPADPATFSEARILANGHPRFVVRGTAGRTYTVQRTRVLGTSASWSVAGSVTPNPGGEATFEDTEAEAPFPRFYRALAE